MPFVRVDVTPATASSVSSRGDPANPPSTATCRYDGEELDWDAAVGWERRHLFAPGETSCKRDVSGLMQLRYASSLTAIEVVSQH